MNHFTNRRSYKKLEEITTHLSSSQKKGVFKYLNFTNVATALQLFFAGLAINLTIKYGDSKEQISRLDSLFVSQQKQIEILNKQLSVSAEQSRMLSFQLKVSSEALSKSIKTDSLSLVIARNKFASTISKILGVRNRYVNRIESITKPEMLSIVDTCLNALNNEMFNPFVLKDRLLIENINSLSFRCYATKSGLNYGISELVDPKAKNTPKTIEQLELETFKDFDSGLERFLSKVLTDLSTKEKIFLMPN